MNFEYFSKNGQILPSSEAVIPLSNIEYTYGFGVYENIKVRKGIIYFIEQHVDRLFQSVDIIGIEHPYSKEDVIKNIKELVEKLKIDACNLKILLIGAQKKEDTLLFIIPLAPLFPDRKLYSQGAKLVSVNYARWFPKAKSLNMLPSYLAYRNAKEKGAYDGLLIDNDGYILEGTRTNFFVIKGKHIVMAPLEKVLEGVTLDTVMYVAKKQGYTFEEKDFSLHDLKNYDGAFLTSTSSKIIPIKQINEFVFGEIPQALRDLMKLYDSFLDECNGIFSP